MTVDPAGVVMNENRATLPRGCSGISRDHSVTIRAGRAFTKDVPGMIFGMSQHEVRVEPCSRLEVTFVNEDQVRHQWMVHGLPKYLYPAGMFHIEASGGQSMTGTFIVPGEDQTYLIHCDMGRPLGRARDQRRIPSVQLPAGQRAPGGCIDIDSVFSHRALAVETQLTGLLDEACRWSFSFKRTTNMRHSMGIGVIIICAKPL
jgi:plastocyanin